MAKRSVKGLYYITHIDNVPSILRHGILSHKRIEEQGTPFTRIYNAEIVANRAMRQTPEKKSLWEYQYLRQLGGRRWFKSGMNHAQTGDLLENLSQ